MINFKISHNFLRVRNLGAASWVVLAQDLLGCCAKAVGQSQSLNWTGAGAAASKLLVRSLSYPEHGPPHRAADDQVSPPTVRDPRENKRIRAQDRSCSVTYYLMLEECHHLPSLLSYSIVHTDLFWCHGGRHYRWVWVPGGRDYWSPSYRSVPTELKKKTFAL